MGVSGAQRLKQLEAENARLKRIVANQALNLQVLKDVLGKPLNPEQRRAVVAYAIQSAANPERTACRYLAVHRSLVLYRPKRAPDLELRGGRWISCAMRSPAAVFSAPLTLWMTSRGSAW